MKGLFALALAAGVMFASASEAAITRGMLAMFCGSGSEINTLLDSFLGKDRQTVVTGGFESNTDTAWFHIGPTKKWAFVIGNDARVCVIASGTGFDINASFDAFKGSI